MNFGFLDIIFLLGFIYWLYMKIKHPSESKLILKAFDYIFGFCMGILMLGVVMLGFLLLIAYIADNHMDIVRNLINDYGGYFLLVVGVLLFCNSAEKFSKLSPDEQKKFFEEIHQNEVERKQKEQAEKQREIETLENQRDSLTTSNDSLFIPHLTKSEIQQNRRMYAKLDKEIRDKRRELED